MKMGSIRKSKTKRRIRSVLRFTWLHLTFLSITRDLDQIHADIRSAKHLSQHKSAKPAEDLPGLGRYYCIECARWFEGERNLMHHRKGKNHKRRYMCIDFLRLAFLAERHAEKFEGFVHYAQSHTRRGRLKLQSGLEPLRLLHLKSSRLLWNLRLRAADDFQAESKRSIWRGHASWVERVA